MCSRGTRPRTTAPSWAQLYVCVSAVRLRVLGCLCCVFACVLGQMCSVARTRTRACAYTSLTVASKRAAVGLGGKTPLTVNRRLRARVCIMTDARADTRASPLRL